MKKSSLIRTTAAIIGLAVGGLLYGQSSNAQDPALYKTADGILDTNYFNLLPRDKDTDVNSLIEGGNVTSLTVLDPIPVLKGKLNYLKKDLRPKNFYNSEKNAVTYTAAEEARFRLINIYEQLLTKVSSEKRTPEYYKSLEKLAKSISVSDHVLTVKELEGILGGFTYVLDKQGKKSNGQGYDVPMLVYFPVSESTAVAGTPKPLGIEGVKTLAKPKPAKQPTTLPDAPSASGDSSASQGQNQTNQSASNQSQTSEVNKSNLGLYFDILASPSMIGGRVGLTGKLFDLGSGVEARGGIGVSGAYGFSEAVNSVQSQPSPTGRYFVGSVTNENLVKLGLDFNLSIGDKNGNLFFGGGPNIWVYGQKTLEQLFDSNNNLVASNSNEKVEATPSVEAYLGYQIKMLRLLVGWDSMKQFYGEAGISFPLGK